MTTKGATFQQVVARRLGRHGLSEPVPADRLPGHVGVMGGAHAQVMAAAELSVGLRVAGATRQSVRSAVWDDRSLVKTFGPRGTVHLLPAADLRPWLAALAQVPGPVRPVAMRMTDEQTDEVVAAIADALDGAELTVDELSDAVVERTGPWAGDLVMPAFLGMWPRWRQAVTTAAHRGALCFGPNRGRKVTYTSPRSWLAGFEPVSWADGAAGAGAEREAALRALAGRYLFAYGPATARDLAQWLSAPKPWATALLDRMAEAGEIEPFEVDVVADPAWVMAGDTEMPDEPPTSVRLLPYFDAYGVGSHPRALVFPGIASERALAGSQAGPIQLLLVDGIVGGVWHHRRSGKRTAVTVEPFTHLSATRRRALDHEVDRVGHILEATPTLTIGPIPEGSHL